MATEARYDDQNGNINIIRAIDAQDSRLNYYCSIGNCHAPMILVKPDDRQAHFRSKSANDHIYAKCILKTITFNPDEYDENLFHINTFIDSILHGIRRADIHNNPNHGGGNVGHNTHIAINSLLTFYAACKSRGLNGTYGDCNVSDILCCEENFENNRDGFEGFKIVEATYYRAVKEDQAIIFNYPCYDRDHPNPAHIKVVFENDADRLRIIRHCKRYIHFWLSPIIFAAKWEAYNDDDCVAIATIHKSTQHAYVNFV